MHWTLLSDGIIETLKNCPGICLPPSLHVPNRHTGLRQGVPKQERAQVSLARTGRQLSKGAMQHPPDLPWELAIGRQAPPPQIIHKLPAHDTQSDGASCMLRAVL